MNNKILSIYKQIKMLSHNEYEKLIEMLPPTGEFRQTRYCSNCNKEYTVDEFYKNHKTGRYDCYCKSCSKEKAYERVKEKRQRKRK